MNDVKFIKSVLGEIFKDLLDGIYIEEDKFSSIEFLDKIVRFKRILVKGGKK